MSDTSGTLAGGTTANYYYNASWQLLQEVTTTSGETPTTTVDDYVWSRSYIDAPVVRFHDGDNDGECNPATDPADDIRHYTWDANQNVTTTITVGYNNTVTKTHYVYDAYGETAVYDSTWTTSTGSPTEDGPFYCGYLFDQETGSDLARNRYYSVTLAAWFTRDPIGYQGGINLYGYIADSPLLTTDPYGRQSTNTKSIGNITYSGCSDAQIRQIRDAGSTVYQEIVTKKCLEGTGLEECFHQLFTRSPITIYCDDCKEKGQEGDGGWFRPHGITPWPPAPCDCYGQTKEGIDPSGNPRKNDPISIAICTDDKGKIPRAGYTLEEVLMHELLHGCGLNHDGEHKTDWQGKMFEACLKKCFPGNKKYAEANPKDCKCRN
jgi:RHS repeat-associated protein